MAVRLAGKPPAAVAGAAGAAPVAGAVGVAVAAPDAGVAGRASVASHLSRSSRGTTILPSTASAGFKVTDSEPEPLSSPSAILKSLAATAVCETSMAPSKLNLPASSGGRAGSGWPLSLTSTPRNVVSCSAEAEAMPASRAFGPEFTHRALEGELAAAGLERDIGVVAGCALGARSRGRA